MPSFSEQEARRLRLRAAEVRELAARMSLRTDREVLLDMAKRDEERAEGLERQRDSVAGRLWRHAQEA